MPAPTDAPKPFLKRNGPTTPSGPTDGGEADPPHRSGLAGRGVTDRPTPTTGADEARTPRRTDRPSQTNRAVDDRDDDEQQYRDDELR